MADDMPDCLARASVDARLPAVTRAKNEANFDKAEERAARLQAHLAIVEANARLGLARDLKTTTKTASWLFRELIAAVNAVEEAP